MCIIALKKEGANITDSQFRSMWQTNSHGFGMAYVLNNRVHQEKGHQDVDKALEAFRAAQKKVDNGIMLLHFRIRSMGAKTKENCHPFKVKGGALVHNGTLVGLGTVNGPSDTNELCQIFGDKLGKDNLKPISGKVEEAIGYGNKIAILYGDKSYIILNERHGNWFTEPGKTEQGVWFSNYGWRTYSSTTTTPSATSTLANITS